MDGVVERLCKNCIFGELNSNGVMCHRYPPTIIYESYDQGGQLSQHFPWLELNDWCGEFKDKWSNVRKEMGDP